jgi:hypothetical protein
VPTVVRNSTGRMNVPSGPGTPKRPPRPEAEARMSKENSSPPTGELAPGRKTLLDWQAWKAMRRTMTDQAPFYWAPRSLWSE